MSSNKIHKEFKELAQFNDDGIAVCCGRRMGAAGKPLSGSKRVQRWRCCACGGTTTRNKIERDSMIHKVWPLATINKQEEKG